MNPNHRGGDLEKTDGGRPGPLVLATCPGVRGPCARNRSLPHCPQATHTGLSRAARAGTRKMLPRWQPRSATVTLGPRPADAGQSRGTPAGGPCQCLRPARPRRAPDQVTGGHVGAEVPITNGAQVLSASPLVAKGQTGLRLSGAVARPLRGEAGAPPGARQRASGDVRRAGPPRAARRGEVGVARAVATRNRTEDSGDSMSAAAP